MKSQNIKGWLDPLSLTGNKELPNRTVPSPMDGVMSPVFCRAMNELRLIDCWITPFIRISNSIPGLLRLSRRIEPFMQSGLPVIVQLLGNSPELLSEAAKRLETLGIDGINLNFACPSNTVVRNGGGGSLLKSPELMTRILAAIQKECPNLSLSVKLRTGFSSPDELAEIIKAVRKARLDFIILHFRTVAEAYLKVENAYERLGEAVDCAGEVPLIGSGDVFARADAEQMFEASGCAGIAVARGLLRNPFLIRDIQNMIVGSESALPENEQFIFFNKMLDFANENPKLYWRRSFFMEIASHLWGSGHHFFEELKNMSDKDMLGRKNSF